MSKANPMAAVTVIALSAKTLWSLALRSRNLARLVVTPKATISKKLSGIFIVYSPYIFLIVMALMFFQSRIRPKQQT